MVGAVLGCDSLCAGFLGFLPDRVTSEARLDQRDRAGWGPVMGQGSELLFLTQRTPTNMKCAGTGAVFQSHLRKRCGRKRGLSWTGSDLGSDPGSFPLAKTTECADVQFPHL